jgi:hypothetical protein
VARKGLTEGSKKENGVSLVHAHGDRSTFFVSPFIHHRNPSFFLNKASGFIVVKSRSNGRLAGLFKKVKL